MREALPSDMYVRTPIPDACVSGGGPRARPGCCSRRRRRRARARRAFVDGREERGGRSVLSWSEEKEGKEQGRRQTAKEERKKEGRKESAPLTKQVEKMQKKRKAVPTPPP